MAKEYDNPKDLLSFHKRVLTFGGMWPLQDYSWIFHFWMTYAVVQLGLMFVDLYQVAGNMDLVIVNLETTSCTLMIVIKIMPLYYSSTLRKLMRKIMSNENAIDYKNEQEREIYMFYTRKIVTFINIILTITLITVLFFYTKNLKLRFDNVVLEDLIENPMAYRVWVFFNVTDKRKYYLAYACQGPMMYIYIYQTLTCVFVWSLLIDACGQLSILSFRIKNTKCSPSESDDRVISEFRDIIKIHKTIVWNVRAIDQSFNFPHLAEIVICTVCMGLCIFNVITNTDEVTEFIAAILYVTSITLCMFGNCLIGDMLSEESLNVRDSYYQTDWYNMSPRCKKMIIISMIRTRIPLYISGGGFYIFSVQSFTGVIKTGMAYGSMLRQAVQ